MNIVADIKNKFVPIILCGGRGKRLLEKTRTIPKPLVEVAGKPILMHVLYELNKIGFGQCIIAIGYLGEKIKEVVGKSYGNMEILYSDSGLDAGMLKRVYNASSLTEKNIYVTYGDTFTKIDWSSIQSIHDENQENVIILTSKIQNPFGVIEYDKNKLVKKFKEKPVLDYYIGHFFAKKNHINRIKSSLIELDDGEGLVNWFNELIKLNKLYAHSNNGLQISFNTYNELEEASQKLNNYFSIKEKS